MGRYINETDYQFLAQALNDYYLVDGLKKMAKLMQKIAQPRLTIREGLI